MRKRTPRNGTGPTSAMASFTTKKVDPNSTAAPTTARCASRSPRPPEDNEPASPATPGPSTSGTGFSGIVMAAAPGAARSRPARSASRSELLEAALAQAGFHLLADDLEHPGPRPALVVTLDDVPAGALVVGLGGHVLDRLFVGGPLLAVAPVVRRQLPGLEGVLLAGLEALQLLALRHVHPELHQHHALVHQHAFEVDDLVVGAGPLARGGEALDPLDEHPPVPRSVEHGHAAPTGQRRPEPP